MVRIASREIIRELEASRIRIALVPRRSRRPSWHAAAPYEKSWTSIVQRA